MIVNFPAKVLSKKKETDDSYIETPYQLFVGNLAWSVKKEILKSLFSQHGNVSAAKVIYSGKGGVPRAFGFVCLSSQSEMEDAIASLHGKVIYQTLFFLIGSASRNMPQNDPKGGLPSV
jgi:RNA recognition motif-containing protein